MFFNSQQIEALSPKPEAFKAGNKLATESQWLELGSSERSLWGKIKGSGSQPYFTQVDHQNFASKCTCPSRQFPCKHGLALLLIFAQKSNVDTIEEPEWVKDWIDKRRTKVEIKEQKEQSPEEIAKKELAKEKRDEDRLVLVQSGIDEINLWLSDLMKSGLLELPAIPSEQFTKLAARMVDAKAPGLASWVKSLANINYTTMDVWYEEAQEIIAKLNLIIRGWNNLEQLSPDWQLTIKNLIGWNQSPKELMDAKDAFTVKDDWIVLGQEKELIEDITVIRTWLWGIESSLSCLDLAFVFGGNSPELKFIPGSVIKAEIAYFEGHHKQRGIVRMIRESKDYFEKMPQLLEGFTTLQQKIKAQLAHYPWLNNEAYLVQNTEVVLYQQKMYLKDNENFMIEMADGFDQEKLKQWILNTGNQKSDVAIVMKKDKVKLLGVFMGQKYFLV